MGLIFLSQHSAARDPFAYHGPDSELTYATLLSAGNKNQKAKELAEPVEDHPAPISVTSPVI
jgi:hypothetical protein